MVQCNGKLNLTVSVLYNFLVSSLGLIRVSRFDKRVYSPVRTTKKNLSKFFVSSTKKKKQFERILIKKRLILSVCLGNIF